MKKCIEGGRKIIIEELTKGASRQRAAQGRSTYANMHLLLEGAEDGCMRAGIRHGSGGRRRSEAIRPEQELGDGGLGHGVKLNGDSRCSLSALGIRRRSWNTYRKSGSCSRVAHP